MEHCISDIRMWMLTDKLNLDDDKTEFMLIGAKQQLSKVNIESLTVGSIGFAPVTVARNLGTFFHSNLNLQEQIHKTCKSGFFHLWNSTTNQTDAIVAMERCISDTRMWMLTDKLKLNGDKTELMLIGAKQQLSKVNIDGLSVGSIKFAPFTVVRNLGSWFHSDLNLQEQILKTCKSGFSHLYNIRRIRKYLFLESASTLVHAFIISRIDYCYSLLFGLPSVHLLKLQRLQNVAARLILKHPSLELKKTLGDRTFSSLPLTYGTTCAAPSHPSWGQFWTFY